jgi:hypothetical protein
VTSSVTELETTAVIMGDVDLSAALIHREVSGMLITRSRRLADPNVTEYNTHRATGPSHSSWSGGFAQRCAADGGIPVSC